MKIDGHHKYTGLVSNSIELMFDVLLFFNEDDLSQESERAKKAGSVSS